MGQLQSLCGTPVLLLRSWTRGYANQPATLFRKPTVCRSGEEQVAMRLPLEKSLAWYGARLEAEAESP